ncbi:hypothetical protein BC567DRAFT_228966 [Phyllosticta citribraziliensis]
MMESQTSPVVHHDFIVLPLHMRPLPTSRSARLIPRDGSPSVRRPTRPPARPTVGHARYQSGAGSGPHVRLKQGRAVGSRRRASEHASRGDKLHSRHFAPPTCNIKRTRAGPGSGRLPTEDALVFFSFAEFVMIGFADEESQGRPARHWEEVMQATSWWRGGEARS